MGARFILSGNDATFQMASATQRAGFLHKTHTLDNTPPLAR
jgi:hypothetical protein